MNSEPTRLSDNQRRFVCRIVFLQFCFLPTFGAIYTIFHQPSVVEWQQRIQAQLPIKVEIESVETPLPNQVVFRGLKVLPTDSGLYPELNGFTANEVDVRFGLLQNEVRLLDPVEIESRELVKVLHRLFADLDESTLKKDSWKIDFRKIVLRDSRHGNDDFVLNPLSVTMSSGLSKVDQKPAFQARILAKSQSDQSNQLVSLDFEKVGGIKRINVATKSATIPANLLQHLIFNAPQLGTNSLFSGVIKLRFDPANIMSGLVEGEILNVQLGGLSDRGQRITGYCDVKDLKCEITDGRIQSAKMNVVSANPISVDRKMFVEAAEFGILASNPKEYPRVSIAKLKMGLKLDGGNIEFFGAKDEVIMDGRVEPAECIAFDTKNEPLVICNYSGKKTMPLVSLARILTGQNASNRSIQFLDNFNLPNRVAVRPDSIR